MIMITLFVSILGLIFGSFINALVWRIHKKRKWWGSERSICPNCKHTLSAVDLVPVLSWVALKGKCRYCHKPISAQYPIVELFAAVLFGLSYCFWPVQSLKTPSINILALVIFVIWLFMVILMMALFVYDFKWLELPDNLVKTLTITSVVFSALISYNQSSLKSLIFAVTSGIILFAIFASLFYLSNEKWIGGGDVKIAFALGLIAGTPVKVFLLIFIASVVGTILTLPLLLSKKKSIQSTIAFGPLLIMATIVVFLLGQSIISWYTQTFLFI